MVSPILTALLLAAAGLDREAVRKHYAEGEPEKAREILEGFLGSGNRCSREDSLFLYKHLGVIHSRRQETREQGRASFRKLLRMDPEAGILDMNAGPMAREVFEDAVAEWEAAAAAPEEKRVVARFVTVPPAGGRRPSAWSGTGRTWVWVGAAGLGLAGAVIGYHYLADDEVPEDRVISLTD